MEFSFIFFAILFVGFAIVASTANEKRVKQAWAAFAAANGMQFLPQGPNRDLYVQGTHDGVQVSVEREVRGSGKNRTVYTCFHANFRNPMPEGMVLSSENVGDRISKFFGGQDIELGEEYADSQLRIRGTDVEGIRGFLSDKGVLDAVMDFVTQHNGRIEKGRARLVISGTITNSVTIKGHLDSVARAAVRIDDALTVSKCQDAVQDARDEQVADSPAPSPAPSTEPETQATPMTAKAPAREAAAVDAPSSTERTSVVAEEPVAAEEPAHPAGGVETAAPATTNESPVEQASTPEPADQEPLTPADLASVATASRADRESVLAALEGRRYSGKLTVERVVWTSDPDASERVYGGRSVVGKLESGPAVEIAFPRDQEGEIKSLRSGDELTFTAELVRYNDFAERLEFEAW